MNGVVRSALKKRCPGETRAVSATLEINQLRSLLYGEQEGNLECPGYLKICENGLLFLDEIGKSDEMFRRDLLRVLESKEFVPKGGTPRKFKRILFVFASTPEDRKNKGSQPVDFWTRMEIELKLPDPIYLKITKSECKFVDAWHKDRFYSLFATFWFKEVSNLGPRDLVKQEKEATTANGSELVGVKKKFYHKVFDPLVEAITTATVRIESNFEAEKAPVSPRRVRSLVRKMAAEYRWLDRKTYPELCKTLAQDFVYEVVLDFEARRKAEDDELRRKAEEEELRRRTLLEKMLRERPSV